LLLSPSQCTLITVTKVFIANLWYKTPSVKAETHLDTKRDGDDYSEGSMKFTRDVVAALVLFSISTTAANSALVTNGSFENGITDWTVTGVGSVHAIEGPLGPFVPQEGARAVLLTTGPGDRGGSPTDSTTLTSSPFQALLGDTLSFSLVFLTEEFTGVVSDAGRLDSFSASLLASNGDALPLLEGDVSMLGFSVLSGAPVSAPDASTFFEARRFDFSELVAPGEYRLQFMIADATDNSFDSGLLIDNVAVGEVPEPATMALAGAALVSLVVARALRSRGCQPGSPRQ
jgi:hypothetical protein